MLLLLQSTLLTKLSIIGVIPDLIMIYVLMGAFRNPPEKIVWVGFIAGLLHGLFTGASPGALAFAKSLAVFFGAAITRRISTHLGAKALILLSSCIIQYVIIYVIHRGEISGLPPLLLRYGLPVAVYTFIVWLPVHGLMQLKEKSKNL